MTTPPPFRILTVCTGNICRSPMAERLLQHGLNMVTPGAYKVESAGTGALVGSAMEPHIEGYVRVMGASADNFSSRQLTPDILAAQDLVLAMTREHRSRIVEMAPAMLKKTFTLRELARILPQLAAPKALEVAERWGQVIPVALRARGMQGPNQQEDDVMDPFRRRDEVYELMRSELTPAVQALINWERANGDAVRPRQSQ
ncbi:low molecular weight phosphatase family protein [Arthrobacter sp. SDTb3-6]|uniref:arsenate reductase/protein-tyrosine-phosphatase family protein n=1 Tax=Arthrobacter sp. SDTb3-6 TaxID=2713571 RepID=UPI00159D8FEA|nr:low molecular weight phosphatase family protein [Arthrobacter sp. SDTb3-6]NVN00787.1 low molecular weight phosphatase family protein [Arthrobacter sp. SDTb3-6]